MLARRAAAEVRVDQQDRGALVARVVERMTRVGLLVVLEEMPLETLERDRHQKPRRHDAVGVDVVAAQRKPAARQLADRRRMIAHRPSHAGTVSSISRTSTTSPAIAAAATIAGLISRV